MREIGANGTQCSVPEVACRLVALVMICWYACFSSRAAQSLSRCWAPARGRVAVVPSPLVVAKLKAACADPDGSCVGVSASIAAVDLRARRASANAVGAHVVPVIGTIETSPLRSRAEAAVDQSVASVLTLRPGLSRSGRPRASPSHRDFPRSGSWTVLCSAPCLQREAAQCGR